MFVDVSISALVYSSHLELRHSAISTTKLLKAMDRATLVGLVSNLA